MSHVSEHQVIANGLRSPTPKSRFVYCLLIDLVGSTEASFERSEAAGARFYQALGQQIRPHLEQLSLQDTQVKFEGDGWLLMTAAEAEVHKLAGLALIMRNRFEREMRILGCEAPIPPLRVVLCAGNDVPILLATGAGDFAANSGRRSARVPKDLSEEYLVIDELTKEKLGNDVLTKLVPEKLAVDPSRPKESPRSLYWVTDLAPVAACESQWKYVRDCLGSDPQPRPCVDLKPVSEQAHWGTMLDGLDFRFAWGNLIEGGFDETSVTLDWISDSSWAPPGIVSRIIWSEVYKKIRKASRDHRDFRFRPLGRVSDVLTDGKHLTLRLQPTMYALFAATNLNLKGGPFLDAVQFWAADNGEEARQPFLASPLNVIGCVVSEDNCLILPKRSRNAYEQPERFQASTGGFVEELEEGTACQMAANAFRREVAEELGLPTNELQVKFLGFGYNGHTGEPDLIALARAPLSGQAMLTYYVKRRKERIQRGKNDDELANIVEGPSFIRSYWDLGRKPDRNVLTDLCRFLHIEDEWSQPSDRVAIVAMLCRLYGEKTFGDALRAALQR